MLRNSETILVTGGAGFIGSHLVGALIKGNPDCDVVSLDNYSSGSRGNHVVNPRVKYIEGDTCDVGALWEKEGLALPKRVFHLGEYSRVSASFDNFDVVWSSNVNGTKSVARFAEKHGAKLIYAGSSTKFGPSDEGRNASPYAAAKANNVDLIMNLAKWYGNLDYVITYFYNVYGPGQTEEGPYATVIGVFQKAYREGRTLPIVKPGTQSRDYTHVQDIVNGLLICADNGNGDGYQLGFGKQRSLLEIADMFGSKISWLEQKPGDRKSGQADNSPSSKARSLGWKPEIDIADYIKDFVARTPVR